MKNLLAIAAFLTSVVFAAAQPIRTSAGNCDLGITINNNYSKAHLLDSIMKHYTNDAMPALSLAVYSEKEGWWAGAHGYASLETKTPMDNCHLQYLQAFQKHIWL